MQSGALTAWDRNSPLKEGPILLWIIVMPVAVLCGAIAMPVITFRIAAVADRCRNRSKHR
jgi:hypothetical protein